MSGFDRAEAERLIAMARSGDRAVLGELLDHYRQYLRVLADVGIDERYQAKVDPSDLVQETFVEAQCDFRSFRGTTERELMMWLKQMLAHNLTDHVSRRYDAQKRDVQLERSIRQKLDHTSQVMDRGLIVSEPSPSKIAERRERAVLLANAMDGLAEDYREVLLLRHLKGLRFPDVARRMGRTEGSVQQLWARALAELRRRIGDEP